MFLESNKCVGILGGEDSVHVEIAHTVVITSNINIFSAS